MGVLLPYLVEPLLKLRSQRLPPLRQMDLTIGEPCLLRFQAMFPSVSLQLQTDLMTLDHSLQGLHSGGVGFVNDQQCFDAVIHSLAVHLRLLQLLAAQTHLVFQ
jgi:hypothetical protein